MTRPTNPSTPGPAQPPASGAGQGVGHGAGSGAGNGAAAGKGLGGGFAPSLGASVTIHGAVLLTLGLALSPWADTATDRGGPRTVTAHLEFADPDPLDRELDQEPESEPEESMEVLPTEDEFDVPVEEFPVDDTAYWSRQDRALEKAALAEAPAAYVPVREPHFPKLPRPAARAVTVADAEPEPKAAEPAPEPAPESAEPAAEPAPESAEPAREPAAAPTPEPIRGSCPPPHYPKLAERRGWTGTVVLLIDVLPDGSVVDVRVEKSSGHTILDDAALRTVATWRFTPSGGPARSTHGQAVTVRKPIQFGSR